MSDFFYNLIILPLYNIVAFLFNCIYAENQNIGIAIFLLSFSVSIVCLPLYLKADKLQEEERKIQLKLKDKINLIKQNYKGDERFMLLQTYYRQENYHPIMRLRSSLSLLLQIPFFMAAYSFFSHLSILNGLSWGIIHDLSKPDALVSCFGITLNILPIAMTFVNILSAYVYTKKKNFFECLTLVTVSLIFLVLLYNAPSGLVLYWLYNNIFSLIKNVALKFTNRLTLIKYSFLFLFTLYCILWKLWEFVGILVFLLLLLNIFKRNLEKAYFNFSNYKKLYILSMLTLFLLVGVYVPANTIASSPLDFLKNGIKPSEILFHNITVYMGIFFFWGSLLYYLSSKNIRKILSFLMLLLIGYFICGLLVIKIPNIPITEYFTFDTQNIDFSQTNRYSCLYYFSIGLVTTIVLLLLFFKKNRIVSNAVLVLSLTAAFLSVQNLLAIHNTLKQHKIEAGQDNNVEKYIHLSKNGKNVLVIFLDRFVGSVLSNAFEEDKNLYQQFTGFTYYPKTLSYYSYTILGYPPILGGYEYTPFMMDSRPGTFEDKFKQSILVLPTLFAKNDWRVSVINPMDLSWNRTAELWGSVELGKALLATELYEKNGINYKEIPFTIAEKMVTPDMIQDAEIAKGHIFFYSILPFLSPKQKQFLYDNGYYHFSHKKNKKSFPLGLLKDYAELDLLAQMTDFDSDKDSFIVFNNNLPHAHHYPDPNLFFSYPNYDLSSNSDLSYKPNFTGNGWYLRQYHMCMASLKLLGKYLDFLKKNELYDNTRIIIVADHGAELPIEGTETIHPFSYYNPILLFKDFNKKGVLITDPSVMTNADVPIIASKDVIQNPINFYTNKNLIDMKQIENREKKGFVVKRGYKIWQPSHYIGKNKVCLDGDYYFLEGDPSEKKNWHSLKFKDAVKLMKSKKGDSK